MLSRAWFRRLHTCCTRLSRLKDGGLVVAMAAAPILAEPAVAAQAPPVMHESGMALIQNFYPEGGIKIIAVEAVSPARDAGLRAEDTLLFVNGRKVQSRADLDAALTPACGTVAQLVVFRLEASLLHRVTLTARLRPSPPCLGITPSETLISYPTIEVVGVVPNSAADAAGLRIGDWVKYVNGEILFGNIPWFSQLVGRYREANPATPVPINIYRPTSKEVIDTVLRKAPPPIADAGGPVNAPGPAAEATTASVSDKAELTKGAVLTLQRTLRESGIETLTESGVWDESTATSLTRVLAELQADEVWGLGWEGPTDGIYSADLAEHLRLTLSVLEELSQEKATTALMRPFLDALDYLKTERIYVE